MFLHLVVTRAHGYRRHWRRLDSEHSRSTPATSASGAGCKERAETCSGGSPPQRNVATAARRGRYKDGGGWATRKRSIRKALLQRRDPSGARKSMHGGKSKLRVPCACKKWIVHRQNERNSQTTHANFIPILRPDMIGCVWRALPSWHSSADSVMSHDSCSSFERERERKRERESSCSSNLPSELSARPYFFNFLTHAHSLSLSLAATPCQNGAIGWHIFCRSQIVEHIILKMCEPVRGHLASCAGFGGGGRCAAALDFRQAVQPHLSLIHI